MLFRRRSPSGWISKTRNFIWPRTGLRRAWLYLWHRITRIAATPHVVALGFAVGAFTSCTPYIGLHFIIAAALALLVGGNVLASAIGTSIGNPLTFPLIWITTYRTGAVLLGYQMQEKISLELPQGGLKLLLVAPSQFWAEFWAVIGPVVVPMTVGSIPIGLAVAVLTYFPIKAAVSSYQRRRSNKKFVKIAGDRA